MSSRRVSECGAPGWASGAGGCPFFRDAARPQVPVAGVRPRRGRWAAGGTETARACGAGGRLSPGLPRFELSRMGPPVRLRRPYCGRGRPEAGLVPCAAVAARTVEGGAPDALGAEGGGGGWIPGPARVRRSGLFCLI